MKRRQFDSRRLVPWLRPRSAASSIAAVAAFGPRRPGRTRLASATSTALRVLRRLSGTVRQVPEPVAFRFVPAPCSKEELADIIGRFNWYLSDLDVDLQIQGSPSLAVLTPSDAAYIDPLLITRPRRLVDQPSTDAHILIHRVTPQSVAQMIRARANATVVDPRFYRLDDSFGYFGLRRRLAPTTFGTDHLNAVDRLFQLVSGTAGKALVVGTGPSAQRVLANNADHEIRVLCNSAIRNPALLEHIRPNIVAFSDHVFHFGPSRYAATFRADLARLAKNSECFFVVPEFGASLLIAHMPELAERTIVIRLEPGSNEWRAISRDDTRVRVTGNVLTQAMLPVALSLADRVDIAGCDGRRPDQTYFWSHGPSVQYGDELMRSVFEAHLSFFRDNDYADYYERHCAELADLLEWAESQGKTVRAVTPSFIPALGSRAAHAAASPGSS